MIKARKALFVSLRFRSLASRIQGSLARDCSSEVRCRGGRETEDFPSELCNGLESGVVAIILCGPLTTVDTHHIRSSRCDCYPLRMGFSAAVTLISSMNRISGCRQNVLLSERLSPGGSPSFSPV